MVSNAMSKDKTKKKKKFKKNAHDYVNYEEEFKHDCKFKTELCNSFTTNGFCKYGNKCRFAHGKDELFDKSLAYPKYKQTDCISFFTNGFCNYGKRCHFRHDDRQELEILPRSWYTYKLLMFNNTCSNNTTSRRLEAFQGMKQIKRPVLYSSNNKQNYNNVVVFPNTLVGAVSNLTSLYQILLTQNKTIVH
jgi:hypothetical protein